MSDFPEHARRLQEQGLTPIAIARAGSRRDWRERLPAEWVVLSTEEIAPGYTVQPS